MAARQDMAQLLNECYAQGVDPNHATELVLCGMSVLEVRQRLGLNVVPFRTPASCMTAAKAAHGQDL